MASEIPHAVLDTIESFLDTHPHTYNTNEVLSFDERSEGETEDVQMMRFTVGNDIFLVVVKKVG